MTDRDRGPSLTDVLDAFAVEPMHDRATLERYLRAYPAFASSLVQLSFELSRTDLTDEPLTARDEELVARAWSRRVSLDGVLVANPLGALKPAERQALARDLGVKVQVVSLLRESRIALETVPAAFIGRLARRLSTNADTLLRNLSVPAPSAAQAYKADGKPLVEVGIDFERALRDSGATEEEISSLFQDR